MADTKKISELNSTSNLANEDEFVVIDKNGTGADSSSSGKTSKIRFDALKNQIGSQGEKGQKGEANKGQKGEAEKGQKGEASKGQKGEANKGQKGEPLEFNDLSSTQRTSLKGQKGADGQKGQSGVKFTFNDLSTSERTSLKGQKGETNKGQKGEASKGQKGEVGVKLTFNDLSTSERTSLKGQKGDANKGQKGEANKGQKGEANKGQKGEANKGQKGEVDAYASAKSLYYWNANTLVGKSTDVLYKTAGGVAWDAGAWSKKSHTNGASISFKVGSRMYAQKPIFIIGFNSSSNRSDPNPGSYFDYAMYYHGVNNKLYAKKGTSNGSGRTLPANGGTFTMTYDAKNVRIYINNDLVFTFNFDLDKTFSMKASLYSPVNSKYTSGGNSYLDPIVHDLHFSPYGATGDDGQKGQKGVAGSATVTTNASAITSGVLNAARVPNLDASKITGGELNAARIPLLVPDKIKGIGNLSYTGKVELYESGKFKTEIHNGASIALGDDLNSPNGMGVFLSGKSGQSNMLMNPLAIGGANGKIPSGNKLWVNGTASINALYTHTQQSAYLFMTKQNTAANSQEGGEIAFQRGDSVGDKNTMIMDVYGRGDDARFRFFDNNPHTKVFAEISKNGLMVNGNLTVTGTNLRLSGKHAVDKFPEGVFNSCHWNNRGHAFLDKTNTIRFSGHQHHNRHSTGTHHHTYANWVDVNIPNDHDKVDDPIEKFHLGRVTMYAITKKGVGYASGSALQRTLITAPDNYRGRVNKIPSASDNPMARIQHDAPIRSISFDHYENNNVWILDTNNTLWGAGYNLRGTLNQGNGHKSSYNSIHNSGTTLNSSGQLIKVMDNVKEANLVGWNNDETGYIVGTNKKMYTLGYNAHGQLGHGNTVTNNTYKAKQVTLNNFGNENVKSFTVSTDHHTKTVYVITENNQLWGWGYNGLYQLGLNHTNVTSTPTILFGGRKVKRVWATRGHHTSAFLQDEDNNIWVCGANSRGQCGVGTSQHIRVWTRVTSLDIVKNSIIDIKSDGDNSQHTSVQVLATYNGRGQLFNTGYNGVGQLGNGTYTNHNTFRRMLYGPRNIVDFHIDHGEESWAQVLFLKDDTNDIWVCGQMHYYMSGDPGSGHNQPRYNTPVRLPLR